MRDYLDFLLLPYPLVAVSGMSNPLRLHHRQLPCFQASLARLMEEVWIAHFHQPVTLLRRSGIQSARTCNKRRTRLHPGPDIYT